MLRALVACLVFVALPAGAGSEEFIDARSSPERVLVSLYNAISGQEYLRAWSYFGEGAAPPFEAFRDGYRDTVAVELRVGAIASEGAAGSIHSQVPVALRATATDGTVAVYVGCYRLTQVQPALQEVPPFRPIVIDGGALRSTAKSFKTTMGTCG